MYAVVQACARRCHGLFDTKTLPKLVITDDTKDCCLLTRFTFDLILAIRLLSSSSFLQRLKLSNAPFEARSILIEVTDLLYSAKQGVKSETAQNNTKRQTAPGLAIIKLVA